MSAPFLPDVFKPDLNIGLTVYGPRGQATFRNPDEEIIIDDFAGGGGASEGIFLATGRHPDEAANHDPEALCMHGVNHPTTKHHLQNIWQLDPYGDVSRGRPIGLAWFSPDCTHFSKAKGGAPLSPRRRGLAWVVLTYAKLPLRLRPRVIILENVEEFLTWGELDENGHPVAVIKGQRQLTIDGDEEGEDTVATGLEFRRWVKALRDQGYRVEWKELRGRDYGAPTSRKRLFVIARNDHMPIVWPAPSHGGEGSGLLPYLNAADCIDFSIMCPSIFARPRDLALATRRRIALGMKRFVLENPRPFIVPLTHQGADRVYDINDPMRTVTGANRGELALVMPFLSTYYGQKHGADVRGRHLGDGIPTQTTENRFALVTAYMAQHNTGVVGHAMTEPVSTITATGAQQAVVVAYLSHFWSSNTNGGQGDPRQPVTTVTAGGQHQALVSAICLSSYYSANGHHQAAPADEPLRTVTAKGRFAVARADLLTSFPMTEDERYSAWWVTRFLEEYGAIEPDTSIHAGPRPSLVLVNGMPMVDIGMRMLTPRELFRAQGFPDSYIIDPIYNGKPLSKTAQVRLCGNSVCPPLARALVSANYVNDNRPGPTTTRAPLRRAVG